MVFLLIYYHAALRRYLFFLESQDQLPQAYNDDNSPGNEDARQRQTMQPDWYKYTLDLPMVHDPGGDQAVYCSVGMNLLGGIVRHATQTWLPEFFRENVATPLQIKSYYWNLMPNGEGYAGGGLYLRPRDQLKLGQLYLNGGVGTKRAS
jgi:CubicO group peptidase (beta-lactamase class C family)